MYGTIPEQLCTVYLRDMQRLLDTFHPPCVVVYRFFVDAFFAPFSFDTASF